MAGGSGECANRKETRGKVNYFYESEKLICISGELLAPFTLDGERMPFAIIESIKFLKSKSTHSTRLADIMSYVFADLSIVLYLMK